jgi:tRNA pseudouridine55 synthase
MDGILVIDKPHGPTSHDVVRDIRRGLRIDKVGHTGTLDPMATGVLPLVLGKGTKLARYLTGGDKTYRATIRLGATTSTLDAEGEILLERPVDVDAARLDAALATLRGDIDQVPPMFSAKKIDGQKLYELARKGIEVEREAKRVSVHRLDLLEFTSPDVTVDIKCSAGTYVRVLAQDLGETLGCGAYLKSLRRLEAGPFTLEHAVELDAVLEDPGAALGRVLPLGRALVDLPRIDVTADIGRMIIAGHQLSVADLRVLDTPTFGHDEALALGVDGGDVIAVVRAQLASEELPRSRRDRRALKTERVLSAKA